MRLLISFFVLLLSIPLAAQDFHRYYDLSGSDGLRDLLVLSPDRLVGIGISKESGLESTSLLLLDGAGEVLSAHTLDFPTRTRGMALARQTDSTFWMGVWQTPVGIIDDWAVYRVNANTGSIVSRFGWGEPNTDEQIRAMTPTPDGGVVVVGNTGDRNEAIISRLAADGTEMFRRGFSMPGNRFTIFTDAVVLPGGDILAAGGFRPGDDDETQSGYLLARIDPAGNLVWSKRYDLDGGMRADGAGLTLELLDMGLIALAGTGVTDDVRQALVLLINADGRIESAVRGEPGTSARGALSVAGETLLIVGTTGGDGQRSSGIVISFDLDGDAIPGTTLIGNDQANHAIAGIRQRPGGGYYLFGRGRLCGDDEEADALLVSIGEDLTDDMANCETTRFPSTGTVFGVSAGNAGELFPRTDARFVPAGFKARAATTRDQVCPRLEIAFRNLPDPLCYREPARLIEAAVAALPENRISRLQIALDNAVLGESLSFAPPAPSVTVTGSGSGVNFIFEANGPGGGAEIMRLLSDLRYTVAAGTTGSGTRTLRLRAFGECVTGPIASFDFNVILDGNPLAGLPPDTILCPGNVLTLSVPDAPGASFTWSTGATTPALTVTDPATYALTITNDCGTDSASVRVLERRTEMLLPGSQTFFACLGDSVLITASPEADVNYRWADGPVGPTRTFRESGAYELVRTNPCSEAFTTFDVNFQDCCRLYVPGAFSPNGDGVNDIFRVFPDGENCARITDFRLQVFDRWGEEIYTGSDLTAGWDGRARAEATGNGYFVYSIRYFNGLETVRRSGGVVLLR